MFICSKSFRDTGRIQRVIWDQLLALKRVFTVRVATSLSQAMTRGEKKIVMNSGFLPFR